VRGYDHHCTLLNNCVGKRTLRVFLLFLLSSTTFFGISGLIAGIAILYEPYSEEYSRRGAFEFNYDLIVMMIIILL